MEKTEELNKTLPMTSVSGCPYLLISKVICQCPWHTWMYVNFSFFSSFDSWFTNKHYSSQLLWVDTERCVHLQPYTSEYRFQLYPVLTSWPWVHYVILCSLVLFNENPILVSSKNWYENWMTVFQMLSTQSVCLSFPTFPRRKHRDHHNPHFIIKKV